ncbi:hypothetical protein F503_05826 [Ophiostoma piceae UAMH 11346]|uniref:UBL3-like ubiquitin domain-containing protein n=1 Tax=Ophiostoma piceae (strain UAMH 11346) TaxID=1262450 RepID=S3CF70_OPHP1|nr:hypothetical protein F503_05826 [Ophiostoma piceae UAMH 11346]
MADAPIMSGANDAAAAPTQETELAAQSSPATEGQTETSSSSLPAALAAETGAKAEAAEEKTANTTSQAGTVVASTSDAPASATASGVLEVPTPPQPAVIRDRSDPLAINADDEIAPVTSATVDTGLVCNITLLLPNGNRHPFRIDERYLSKRGVEVPELTENGRKDPFSVSVYKLKELILREWREEWEGKPASPSSIRLIHFGKLLDDKEQLRKYHFSPDSPNVVHMSVKPADVVEDEEAAKGKTSGRESRSREGGGGCCVIL